MIFAINTSVHYLSVSIVMLSW